MDNYDKLVKIAVIGDSSVGKTSLLDVYCDGYYNKNTQYTVGVDFKSKILEYDSVRYKLQIWDTAGQERFRSITKSYYRNANIILLVFDLTNAPSFHNLKDWIETVEEVLPDKTKYRMFLIGNKSDLKMDSNTVTSEEIKVFISKYDLTYFEASAKNNTGINLLFQKVAQTLGEMNYEPKKLLIPNKTYRTCC